MSILEKTEHLNIPRENLEKEIFKLCQEFIVKYNVQGIGIHCTVYENDKELKPTGRMPKAVMTHIDLGGFL
jgi:hypothetical protein